MKVLHVVGKEMKKQKSSSGKNYEFLDGDVYVIDNGNTIYIWLGKDCGVDEKTVGAWVANQLDNSERGGEPTVISVTQGEEPDKLKGLIEISVKDGDTPGFLKHVELDMVNYGLYRVSIKEDTVNFDDAEVKGVKLDKSSLSSEDVFILDGNERIFMFIGKNAQREEKFEGQKFMQKIDTERNYLPLTYTIYEGEGSKSEAAFYDLLSKAGSSGPVVSVEDQRELKYRPEDSKSAEEHKEETSEKKGFLSKLFSFFK